MKNKSILAAVVFALLTVFSIEAQEFPGLDKSPMDAASFPTSYRESNKAIKITYSRPQLNGRSLSELAPNGKVWRTGANEACELTLYKDMKLGDTAVKAGTYTFYLIPGDSECKHPAAFPPLVARLPDWARVHGPRASRAYPAWRRSARSLRRSDQV